MNDKIKYYTRRIIATCLIASPCYIWSQTLVILFMVGLTWITPSWSDIGDIDSWVSLLVLTTWILMFVIGWYGSRLLIPKPIENKTIDNQRVT